jgi:hypothetical protein
VDNKSNLIFTLPNTPIDSMESDIDIQHETAETNDDEYDDSRKNQTLEEIVLDAFATKRSSLNLTIPEPVLSASSEFKKQSAPSIISNASSSSKNKKDFWSVQFPQQNLKEVKSNYISTTKYTIWTFLPKNLYFQFSRVYNVYFLLGALSTLGGTSSISPGTMIAPLLIVLLFSAIKDGYEDYVSTLEFN